MSLACGWTAVQARLANPSASPGAPDAKGHASPALADRPDVRLWAVGQFPRVVLGTVIYKIRPIPIAGPLRRPQRLGRLQLVVYTSLMPKRSSKKPGDANQLAKAIVDEATGESKPAETEQQEGPAKNPAAVALGRLGGKKGGPARAKKLGSKRRSQIAKKAAQKRWANQEKSG